MSQNFTRTKIFSFIGLLLLTGACFVGHRDIDESQSTALWTIILLALGGFGCVLLSGPRDTNRDMKIWMNPYSMFDPEENEPGFI